MGHRTVGLKRARQGMVTEEVTERTGGLSAWKTAKYGAEPKSYGGVAKSVWLAEL